MSSDAEKATPRVECRESVELTIAHLSKALIKVGVKKEDIDQAVEEVKEALLGAISSPAHKHVETGYFYDRSQFFASERKDYFGRALIQSIEKYFPMDEETAEHIKHRPVKGHLPRQTAEGLIQVMKSVLDFSTLNNYETKCLNKAAMYRKNRTGL